MESFGGARKRGKPDGVNGNGGFARSKRSREMDSLQLGSKSKPCTKFFSTAGCHFGEGCHFQHFVPGGYNAVAQMTNVGNPAVTPPPARGPMGPPISDPHGHGTPSPAMKTKMCSRFNSAEGCKFGVKCHFAHGEWELGKPFIPSHNVHMGPAPMLGGGRMGGHGHGHFEPPPLPAATSFGASATAKISVHASLAGGIIGKGGANTKHICRVTGAKLAIRDNESDVNLKNIELEGTFDQVNKASVMVQELIMNISSSNLPPMKAAAPVAPVARHGPASSNYKTKLCEKFAKGSCTFGDQCHFAHGTSELHKAAV